MKEISEKNRCTVLVLWNFLKYFKKNLLSSNCESLSSISWSIIAAVVTSFYKLHVIIYLVAINK